ncbi:MAG: hypothetical protein AMXMBFR51_20950 [Ignavibacteriota bacterium]
MILIIIIIVFSQQLLAQSTWVNSDSTSTILLRFSEPIKTSDLSVNNFSVKDSADLYNYKIYAVGIPQFIDSCVVIICERLRYKRTVIINAFDLEDLAGNKIDPDNSVSYYHNGFNPSLGIPLVR